MLYRDYLSVAACRCMRMVTDHNFFVYPSTELNSEISCSFIEEIQLALVHNRLLDDFTEPTLEISLPYATDFTLNGTY